MQNDRIQKIAKEVIQFEINALNNLKNSINLSLSKVVKLILNCKQGKVIISGVGKSGLLQENGQQHSHQRVSFIFRCHECKSWRYGSNYI